VTLLARRQQASIPWLSLQPTRSLKQLELEIDSRKLWPSYVPFLCETQRQFE
jgi:hypothetical protein